MKKIELVVSKQNNVDTIRYDLGAADVYDDRAADKAAQLNNIIPFQYSDEDGRRAITSYAHEDLNLETFIKNVLAKREVLCILSGLASVFEVGTQGIPVSYIVKDANYIYVNKETLAVKAVLIAVKQDVMALAEIPAFFRDIISKMRFSDGDKDNYVARLITLINSNDFSVSKLKEMLNEQLESMGLFISKDNGLMDMSVGGNAAPAKGVKVNKLGVMNNMRPQQPYGVAPNGMAPQMQPQGQPPMGMAPQMQPQGRPPMGMAPQMQPQGQPPMGMAPQMQPQGQPPMGMAPQMQPQGQPPMGMAPQMQPQGQVNPSAPKPMGQPPMGMAPQMQPQGQVNPSAPKPMVQPPQGQPPMGMAPQMQPQGQVNPSAPIMTNSEKTADDEKEQNPIVNEEKQGGIMGNLVGQLGTKPIPHLVRKKTGEAINITKPEFTIGKSKTKADYAIENNTAISRVHCIIVQRDGVNYIKDNNSTNHTYIDGVELIPGKEVLLKNKMTIQLGDEEFTFLLRKGE